ncbi:MAG TPA: type II toxin-antitoxin system VapC family toxin [Thermoanaerobaculia bacterium]|nr:type II toxin-antitoxin system VapC family toxin [Thermoanaerobaculia bacterium]
MAFYDASALVKLYVEEWDSGALREFFPTCLAAMSRLSFVEIASALGRLCREGALPLAERNEILDTLALDSQSFYILEFTESVTTRARALLARHPLRAGDAIQLASCLLLQERVETPLRFVAYDARLRAAAEAEGLTTVGR